MEVERLNTVYGIVKNYVFGLGMGLKLGRRRGGAKTRLHTSTLCQRESCLDCAKLFHILQHAARSLCQSCHIP